MTLFFTGEEETEFLIEQRKKYFGSGFACVNSFNCWRPGNTFLILGETSGGKSTFIRSLVRDIILHPENKTVQLGVWLSEETLDEYRQQLSLGLPSNEELLRSEAFSEMDHPQSTEKTFMEWIETTKPDILLLDNITTSKFYMDKKPDVQAAFAIRLKEAVKRLNIASIVMAHTDSSVNSKSGIIEINNIRGSKQIANLSEFAMILQRFKIDADYFATIRIVKHRSQEIMHDCYVLKYDPRFRSYLGDAAIPWKTFKDNYEKRNRL